MAPFHYRHTAFYARRFGLETLVYRRRSPDGLVVSGDQGLLQLWSSSVAFA